MDQELLTLLQSLPAYCKSLGAAPCDYNRETALFDYTYPVGVTGAHDNLPEVYQPIKPCGPGQAPDRVNAVQLTISSAHCSSDRDLVVDDDIQAQQKLLETTVEKIYQLMKDYPQVGLELQWNPAAVLIVHSHQVLTPAGFRKHEIERKHLLARFRTEIYQLQQAGFQFELDHDREPAVVIPHIDHDYEVTKVTQLASLRIKVFSEHPIFELLAAGGVKMTIE